MPDAYDIYSTRNDTQGVADTDTQSGAVYTCISACIIWKELVHCFDYLSVTNYKPLSTHFRKNEMSIKKKVNLRQNMEPDSKSKLYGWPLRVKICIQYTNLDMIRVWFHETILCNLHFCRQFPAQDNQQLHFWPNFPQTRLKFLISHNLRGNTVITLKSKSVSHI
jgi:hypothetical protein